MKNFGNDGQVGKTCNLPPQPPHTTPPTHLAHMDTCVGTHTDTHTCTHTKPRLVALWESQWQFVSRLGDLLSLISKESSKVYKRRFFRYVAQDVLQKTAIWVFQPSHPGGPQKWQIYYNLFVCFPTDGYLSCSQLGTILTSAAVNILFMPFGTHLLDTYIRVELLNHRVSFLSAGVDITKPFSKGVLREILCFSSTLTFYTSLLWSPNAWRLSHTKQFCNWGIPAEVQFRSDTIYPELA